MSNLTPKMSSKNFYNYEETNVTGDPGAKKFVVPRNTKKVHRVQEHFRVSISIMIYGSANEYLLSSERL